MVISRETDYSMRILRNMVDYELRSISDICEIERISKQKGYQLAEKLKKAGMICMDESKKGFYRLQIDLKEWNLYDLMTAVDNHCCVNLCLAPEHACPWRETHLETSRIHPKLGKIQEEMDCKLKEQSLDSLLEGEFGLN